MTLFSLVGTIVKVVLSSTVSGVGDVVVSVVSRSMTQECLSLTLRTDAKSGKGLEARPPSHIPVFMMNPFLAYSCRQLPVTEA
jgi:hypothetical protein